MHKDIVKKLRYYCDCTDTHGKCFECECADEIEHLRKTISYMIIQGNLMNAELEELKANRD